MLNINDTDFVQKFKIADATVGVVGYGYVGTAVEHFFSRACTVLVHDKAKPELRSLGDLVSNCEVIFVCVPTPMRNDGSCYTGIVEEVISNIKLVAKDVGRTLDSFIVVVKSTVRPGFTEEMQCKHLNMRLMFSPEFLTEKNSVKDFENTNRILLGGDEDDARIVFKYFEGVIPKRVELDQTLLLQCHPTAAEMAKLYTNGMLMTKVLFSNEMYLMCQKFGVEYDEVRYLACLDPRIGSSHTAVPGHDGQLGAGGHCFPKDINNLRAIAKEIGLSERLFTAVIERNNEIREDKDWLAMQGRAVIDE